MNYLILYVNLLIGEGKKILSKFILHNKLFLYHTPSLLGYNLTTTFLLRINFYDQTQARSNIYALLSRVLLQETDPELLDQIKNDENILDFFPTFKEWDKLNTVESSTLIDEYINPDFSNLSLLHLIPYETFYTRDDQMIETGGANPVTNIYSAYDLW